MENFYDQEYRIRVWRHRYCGNDQDLSDDFLRPRGKMSDQEYGSDLASKLIYECRRELDNPVTVWTLRAGFEYGDYEGETIRRTRAYNGALNSWELPLRKYVLRNKNKDPLHLAGDHHRGCR